MEFVPTLLEPGRAFLSKVALVCAPAWVVPYLEATRKRHR